MSQSNGITDKNWWGSDKYYSFGNSWSVFRPSKLLLQAQEISTESHIIRAKFVRISYGYEEIRVLQESAIKLCMFIYS